MICFPTELCRPGGDEERPTHPTFQDDLAQAAHVPDAPAGFVALPRPGLLPVPVGPAELPWPPPPQPAPDPALQAHAAQHQCLPAARLPDQPSPPPAALLAPPAELPPQPAPQHAAGPPAAPPVPPHGTTGTAPHELLASRAAGECSAGDALVAPSVVWEGFADGLLRWLVGWSAGSPPVMPLKEGRAERVWENNRLGAHQKEE